MINLQMTKYFWRTRKITNKEHYIFYETRDSSVGIALGYGLDDRGFEYRWGLGVFPFIAASQTGSGALQASYQVGTGGSFPRGKAVEV
jgi:hypothetical protein